MGSKVWAVAAALAAAAGLITYDFRDMLTPNAFCMHGGTDLPLLPAYQGWVRLERGGKGVCIQVGDQRSYSGLFVSSEHDAAFLPSATYEERYCKSGDAWEYELANTSAKRSYAQLAPLLRSGETYAVIVRGRRTSTPVRFEQFSSPQHVLLIDGIMKAMSQPPGIGQDLSCDDRAL